MRPNQRPNQDALLLDGRGLVETGDLDLGRLRTLFTSQTGTAPTLRDDQIILCQMWQDDDYGLQDVVNRMIKLQAGDESAASATGAL